MIGSTEEGGYTRAPGGPGGPSQGPQALSKKISVQTYAYVQFHKELHGNFRELEDAPREYPDTFFKGKHFGRGSSVDTLHGFPYIIAKYSHIYKLFNFSKDTRFDAKMILTIEVQIHKYPC